MLTYGVPILYALGLWWGSTIAILYLDGLPRRTFRWSVAGMSALTLAAFVGMFVARDDRSLGGAYHGFTCGVIAWAWQILTFYMGLVTGPSKSFCAPEWHGWRRFVEALRTCLHHELAIVAMAAIITTILWRADNPLALWTFLVLWWMHTSAKLNVFFGVRNLGEEFIPHHMRYILSYMSRRSMNTFFPLSVSVSTVVTMMLVRSAVEAQSDQLETAGYTMLATLMVLAVLEHWLLVTPFDANVLWKWGAKKASAEQAALAAIPAGETARAPQNGSALSRPGATPAPAELKLNCV